MSQTVRSANPKNVRKSKAPWLIWLLLALAVSGWWSLYQSKWFIAQGVTVTGNSRLTVDQISLVAAVPIGNSLMSINTAAITAQLTALPEIKVATVERGWPHTILIKVTERTPIAVAATMSGFNLIDSEGHNAGVVAAPPAGLLVISAEPDSKAMLGAIDTLAAIPSQWQLIGLAAATQDNIVATLSSGAVITFGSGERAADKVEVAQALMDKGYSVINVSAPDAATVLK
ncbi:MAG: FtsQ-type POTRA domain-containing protein [Candidatus Nanopelagicales bacterium]|jgi:cell division protein FtsQ|nr:FtsQ-type POTRA domain-containing protein [Candidatus Nanopelagicales bacterium]MDP4895754.1 FtsQ-type POTRA domain-containing protein [Candidatus Nanopelagicales bacterium]MDP5050240.1 FtsQ-type POTRA domain-containing protein [Candidatus Nanopelagicales bacterium]